MPAPSEILASLSAIANQAFPVAVVWHVAGGLALLALLWGVRPSRRAAAWLSSLPLASVSVTAWFFHNPFNGLVLGLSATALAALAISGSREAVDFDRGWAAVVGVLLIAFGWFYPHFLSGHSVLAYAYAAPLGTLPCPTLAFVSGVALAARGLVGGAWRLTLVAVAAFYALFGILRLGVYLDAVLLLGPIGLGVQHWRDSRYPPSPRSDQPRNQLGDDLTRRRIQQG